VSLETRLEKGLAKLEISDPPGLRDNLLAYIRLLDKWNRTYNLSAVRDPDKMVTHHLLDSLAVLPWLRGQRLIDVGSGAGLPGIPLAIARPDMRVTLLDSNQKKTAFMEQVALELKLSNVEVVNRRAEDYRPPQPFDIVITRALSDLDGFVSLTRHLGSANIRWLAMKGVYPYEEFAQLSSATKVVEVATLAVPDMDADRCLVIMEPGDA
jgi:16S rRNA (guanine527-N7)-methyltransferase